MAKHRRIVAEFTGFVFPHGLCTAKKMIHGATIKTRRDLKSVLLNESDEERFVP